MTSKRVAITVCLMVQPVLASVAATAAQISGQVFDQSGRPAAGVTVHFHNLRRLVAGPWGASTPTGGLTTGTAITDSAGAFTISNLHDDTYYLCAYGITAAQLPTCSWGGGEKRVALSDGQNVDDVTLQLTTGTVVTFKISDPDHRIVDLPEVSNGQDLLPLNGGNLSIGVFSGQAYQRAPLVSTTAAGRIYQLTVPNSATIRFYLATDLSVTEANGQPLAVNQPSAPISLTRAGSDGHNALTINLAVRFGGNTCPSE